MVQILLSPFYPVIDEVKGMTQSCVVSLELCVVDHFVFNGGGERTTLVQKGYR